MGKREIISEQRKFNYGALFGSWLWGFCNRIKHWTVYTGFVMFILSFTSVPYMGIAEYNFSNLHGIHRKRPGI